MAYSGFVKELATEWYNTLDQALDVPVYKESVDINEGGHHVVVRAESVTTEKNKGVFLSTGVIIVEIVTVFFNHIDRSILEDIDATINATIFPTPSTHSVSLTSHQINSITLQTSSYLTEDDGTKKFYTKISRYEHLISQN